MTIAIYFIVALFNVFLHVFKNILVIKSTKFRASLANCICYTFAAVVIKFIAEVDLWIAVIVQATTNFAGNWLAIEKGNDNEKSANSVSITEGRTDVTDGTLPEGAIIMQ